MVLTSSFSMCTPVDSALTTAAPVAGREDNILSQSVLGELVSSGTCEECACESST